MSKKELTWDEIKVNSVINAEETINHPYHYQGKTEVIEIIEQLAEEMEGKKAFNLGNVIKYIFRHEDKGGLEDLKKAAWYLDRVIKDMEGESE